jgi:hypothetical protein
MAAVGLLIAARKSKAALKELRKGLNVSMSYLELDEYLNYAISLSRKLSAAEEELYFVKERIIRSLYLLPSHLDELRSLVGGHDYRKELLDLASTLDQRRPEHFLKKAELLLAAGRGATLLGELRREGGNFAILHQAVMQEKKEPDLSIVKLYVKRLGEALNSARLSRQRNQLLRSASEFFIRLSSQARIQAEEGLLIQVKDRQLIEEIENSVLSRDTLAAG